MEKKTSKHERNDAKTQGCVYVIYGDESAFSAKMHVDALPTVHTPCSPSTCTGHTYKDKHDADMTSLMKVKNVNTPEDRMRQTLFVSITNKNCVLLTFCETQLW